MITAKLKTILIGTAIFVVLSVVIIILSVSLHKSNKEKSRLKDNYEIEMLGDKSRQQTIDVSELKEYFSKEVEELKEYGIRARNVENIVEVEYRFIDTVRYRDTLVYVYDTAKSSRRADFRVMTNCYVVGGQIVGDTIEIDSMGVFDSIMVALYKEKKKCIFDRRKIKAIAVSGCSGDTLAILRNLKVER